MTKARNERKELMLPSGLVDPLSELVRLGQESGDYDLPDEFEMELSERNQMVMSSSDLSMIRHEYEVFKDCALRAGYSIEQLSDKGFNQRVRFFKPNNKRERSKV